MTNIEIRVEDVYQSRQMAQDVFSGGSAFPILPRIGRGFGPICFRRSSWKKPFTFWCCLLMVLIGAFNIVSTLIMVVMEKKKGYRDSTVHGRDASKHSKDFSAERLCDRHRRHDAGSDSRTG